MMLFQTLVTSILAASLTYAVPVFEQKRRPGSGISVVLTSDTVKIWLQFNDVNSTGVVIDSTTPFDNVQVSRMCPNVCVPGFNCQISDKNLQPIIVTGPGNARLNHVQVGKIACGLFPEGPTAAES